MKLDLHGVRFRKTRGIALVLVLGFLVLITGLIIAFFSSVSTELTGAKSYAAGVSTKQLADSAAQIVMAQISTATSGTNVAWASQPGMIRTYGDGSGGASGAELAFYKLYSSDNMVVTGSASLTAFKANPAADAPPAWSSQAAIFTDLNAPVITTTGTNYPILDPGAFGNVQGASITGAPTVGTTDPVPMPARWLYVLKDGRLTAPDSPGGASTTATFVNAPIQPSATNPIVGRIAFWTDDETCKVNINTASEGTFWDVPRVKTSDGYDYNKLANNEPVQHEFQRYPGHPAMTSLSTVFPSLTPAQIYAIVPRVTGGGSNCGTQYSVLAPAITTDTDRLYASLDELMFTPGRTQNNSTYLSKTALEAAKFFLTAHSRAPETNLFNKPRIACWPIYNGLAIGRVTPYDQLIAFCSTLPNSTSSGQPNLYYFQRQNPNSTTNDIGIQRNKDLYSYLQTLTSQEIPGFGGDFLQKYGSTPYGMERDQILTEIFDYIRCTNLCDSNVTTPFTPGYTGANSNVALPQHGWVIPTHHPNGTMGFGRMYTISELGIGFICNADGNDTTYGSNNPSTNTALSGTLQAGQKCIQAIVVPEFFSPMMGYTSMRMDMQIEIIGLDKLTISASGTTVNLGFPSPDTLHNNVSTAYNCEGSNVITGRAFGGNPSWRIFGNGTTKGSPARSPLAGDTGDTYPFIGSPVIISGTGGTMAFSSGTTVLTSGTTTYIGGTITVNIYAGATSQRIPANLVQTLNIPLPNGTFPIPNLVNKGTPAPSSSSHGGATSMQNWWAFSKAGAVNGYPGRLNSLWQEFKDANGGPQGGSFFRTTDGNFDVVRTVLPKHGDYRLVAARQNLPVTADVFVKHPYYDNDGVTIFPLKMIASNLTCALCSKDQGFDRRGKYNNWLTYDVNIDSLIPDIPYTALADYKHLTPTDTGDYDSALPWNNDGPFVNKPDEGSGDRTGGIVPYFDQEYSDDVATLPNYFSPNRLMPSPGMFGSLPTGVLGGIPWKTLLFRPQSNHPSYVDPNNYASDLHKPSDHLLMDLFWMPVVEPYAISDRFSTAGKINMNYQIVPFTYIERSTGIRALLKGEKLTAIPCDAATMRDYKEQTTTAASIRLDIDVNDLSNVTKKDTQIETLNQFAQKFAAGNIFKSASEICDLHIVPTGKKVTDMADFTNGFWSANTTVGHALTGENLREKIYTTLYPRLTTKSNTFTVHFRVQALQKRKSDPNQAQWVEGKDLMTGENRGSTIIERYIDSNDPDLPDFATKTANPPVNPNRFSTTADRFNIDNYYRFRVVSTKQFAP